MNTRTRNILFFIALVLAFGGLGFWLASLTDGTQEGSAAMSNATTYESGPFRVSVSINPQAPRVGKNQLMVMVTDAQGKPVTDASIKAFGEMPAMGAMAAMRAPADLRETEPGMYTGPLSLEMRGEWPLSISIQKEGLGSTRLGFDMATGRDGLSIASGGTVVAGSMQAGGGSMSSSAPEQDDRGYYTVGKYKIKVDVLAADAMTDSPDTDEMAMRSATVLVAGSNRLQVAVQGSDDQPVNDAVVRVAAQRESGDGMSMGMEMGEEHAMQMEPTEEHAGEAMDMGPTEEHAGEAMGMEPTDEHAGEAMDMEPTEEHAGEAMTMEPGGKGGDDEHAGDAMQMEPTDEHAGEAMQMEPTEEHAGEAMGPEASSDGMEMSGKAMSGQMDTSAMRARNSEVVALDAVGDGLYRGQLNLSGDGDYVLVVDVSTDDDNDGHGDLVLAFTTGESGFKPVQATPENGQGIAYYTCSMHPSVREAGPGQCPICSMDLTPVSKEQVASGVITIDARRRQMIGVQTGRAQMRDLNKSIRAVGTVAFDERRVHNVSLKFDAWIAELQADFVGVQVNKGQKLFSVYSPELLSAQQEYLETRQRLSARGSDDSLVQAARRRLMLWDISPAQVRALERRGQALEYLPIFAPASGTVVEKMINEGSAMKTGDMLLRIADLSTVWVDAEVYEADLPLISTGMAATVTLPYQAGTVLDATVDYIYPYLSGGTRTARIRLVLDNPNGVLKPDMYAEVKLQADLGRRLMVPDSAVLVAGESRVVFKDLGEDGKLKPVRVKTGQRVGDWVEITEGLSPGDSVVTSGNFLIASEAKLKTGIEQW